MKQRSDTSVEVKSYIATFESMCSLRSTRLLKIRCDNAGKNIPEELELYCNSSGIEIKKSPEYAPKSNGLAERVVQENCTRAKSILVASGLPANLWGEAINHENLLRNRSPSSRINNKIPVFCNGSHEWRSISRMYFRLGRDPSPSHRRYILCTKQPTTFGIGERKAERSFWCQIIGGVEVFNSLANNPLSITDHSDVGDLRQEIVGKMWYVLLQPSPYTT